ncbi:MAG: PAS domain S-box protein [Armatimonadetes bacterium]|nr:PAS domain S-box protein [Armatimonadota bacterium]
MSRGHKSYSDDLTQRSLERYESLMRALANAVWSVDAEGRFVEPQPDWQSFTGQSWDESAGFGWFDAFHPDDRERIRSLWSLAESARTVYRAEGRVRSARSNRFRPCIIRAAPLLNPAGEVREWTAALTDVDAEVKTREALRQAQQKMELFHRSTREGLLVVDREGIITEANERAESLFAYGRGELDGIPVERLVPLEFRGRHSELRSGYHAHPRARSMAAEKNLRGLRKDGTEIPVEIALTPLNTAEGLMVMAFVRDVTDKSRAMELAEELGRRAEQEAAIEQRVVQQERQRLSRELHDSVSQSLYGIGLGARTALALLSQDPSRIEEPLRYILTLAESGLSEMRALIHALRPETLESEGLMAALKRQVKSLAARYDLEIELKAETEPDLPLSAKHEAFRVCMEALNNAVKHAEARHVTVSLRPLPGGLKVEVRDDGFGFDPEQRKPEGIGLRSMRERVSRLGGSLQIESHPGEGTSVIAFLPGEAQSES